MFICLLCRNTRLVPQAGLKRHPLSSSCQQHQAGHPWRKVAPPQCLMARLQHLAAHSLIVKHPYAAVLVPQQSAASLMPLLAKQPYTAGHMPLQAAAILLSLVAKQTYAACLMPLQAVAILLSLTVQLVQQALPAEWAAVSALQARHRWVPRLDTGSQMQAHMGCRGKVLVHGKHLMYLSCCSASRSALL